jgi:glycosyltransferase involved in cell wall biosynthesis
MIKILFFIESLAGGGAEKVLRTLVNNMDSSRFDVTVQTLFPEDRDRYTAKHVKYRSTYPKKTAAAELMMRAEAALGLTYPMRIKGDYDIEAAYLECGATKIMAGSTNKRALKLAWVHCDLAKKTDAPAAFVRKTAGYYRKFDKVVCVSEGVRRSFAKMYGDGVKTDVLHNAVDSGEILSKARESLPQGIVKKGLTAVAVGRLSEQKSFMRLLRVHKELADNGIRHDLWIAGEGPEREKLQTYIDENKLNDSVKLLGFLENPYSVMRTADVLVCSSLYEGFSTFVTEGLILGKPVVTTDCTGMRELLGDSEYGLITENSEDGLYSGLKRMLTDTALREKYENAAAVRGRDFSVTAIVRETENYLEQTLKEKN